MFKLSQKGISLYISVIMLAIILAVVLGLNTILLGQMKMIRVIGYSVIAYYTAETGTEWALYKLSQGDTFYIHEGWLEIEGIRSYYNVENIEDLDSCGAEDYCIRSVGDYKGTKRAVEIKR